MAERQFGCKWLHLGPIRFVWVSVLLWAFIYSLSSSTRRWGACTFTSQSQSYSNSAMRIAGGGHCFQFAHLQTRSGPVWDPRVGTSKWKCPLSAGGHRASYLLPGIWLKCAPFHSPRVPLCASACHYLQMRDFTLVGHVNRDCDANFMDSSKGKFALLPTHPTSLPSVPVAPFVRFRTCIHRKLLGLIRSPPTTL